MFLDFNQWSTVGAFGFFLAQFIFIGNMLASCYGWFGRTRNLPGRVWEGAHGLEWTVASPPPYHTFEDPPAISEGEFTSVHDEEDALDHHKLA
jgi:cytochrome c oxidase subunit 1